MLHIGNARAAGDKTLDGLKIGDRSRVSLRRLIEPFPRLALFEGNLLAADIDQLLGIEGT
jgi:hypothetical protein